MAIVLIGFMGAGKTTVGELLSRKMHIPFIDLDKAIVELENLSIPEIFEKFGEAYFRKLEHDVLKTYINKNIIIATGGGIIENPNNMEILQQNNLNIWVDANINTVYNRIVGDNNRPNAQNKSFEEIKKLYNSRISRYNEIAYIKVNNEHDVTLSVQEIHNQIMTDDEN
ncbi:shikimate kinase [Macrococcoides goetzii]|uniref:Shikimate kinase n=1 Tax=Macrococcoides goetzii TaxID=1891097 RepID=A0A2G5NT47_9STAP|nr:shikimate kinase [Macrococcus goetzii]RAI82437.1 shikimate kinase [Macrococcus goetzii]